MDDVLSAIREVQAIYGRTRPATVIAMNAHTERAFLRDVPRVEEPDAALTRLLGLRVDVDIFLPANVVELRDGDGRTLQRFTFAPPGR